MSGNSAWTVISLMNAKSADELSFMKTGSIKQEDGALSTEREPNNMQATFELLDQSISNVTKNGNKEMSEKSPTVKSCDVTEKSELIDKSIEVMSEKEPVALNGSVFKENSDVSCGGTKINTNKKNSARSSLMHDMYETVVSDFADEPTSKDEPDVKAFFKALADHGFQSKLVYVLTVVSIVMLTHFSLARQWILPYYFTVVTPVLLLLRLISYWKLKYQYFLLDFCYFANTYLYIYIWLVPSQETVFAVGFAAANGPLIWALFVFRNSLVLHSLDKVTSLYIHLIPSLLSFVIRWYPDETSQEWHREFPKAELGFDLKWLLGVPFLFMVAHQVFYVILVNVILRPSEEYLNIYRYLMSRESSLLFRLCNMFGERFSYCLYLLWCHLLSLIMISFNLIWYNYFIAHCFLIATLTTIAVFNGATYYIDVFQLQGSNKQNHKLKSRVTNAKSSWNELPKGAGDDAKTSPIELMKHSHIPAGEMV